MTILTAAAVTAMAVSCQVAAFGEVLVTPAMVKRIAWTESRFDSEAVNRNANGTADFGLMQLNASNLPLLGLTPQTAMEPCRSIVGGVAVLVGKYNASTAARGIANGYVAKVLAAAGGAPAQADRPIRARPGGGPTAASVFWHPPMAAPGATPNR